MSAPSGSASSRVEMLPWAFLLVGLVAFAIATRFYAGVPPATGFENDILAAYPAGFWASFLVVLGATILAFITSALVSSPAWKPAFGLLAANYGLFFYLPVHRGYKLYERESSDALAHLGFVKRVLKTGTFGDIFYPLEHALLSTLAFLDVPLDVARYTLSYGLTIVFILSVALLLRELTGDARAFPIGLAVAAPLVFVYQQIRISPAMLSFMFAPLVLFLVERARRVDVSQYRLLYIFLGLGVVFFHPMSAIFIVILVISTAVFWRLYGSREEIFAAPLETRIGPLLVIVWYYWYSGFGRTQRSIRNAVRGITSDTQENLAAAQAERASTVDFTIFELAMRAFQKYGLHLLYFTLAGLIGLVVLDRVRRGKERFVMSYATMQFFLGVFLAIAFLFVYLIAFDPVRVSRYAMVMAVLLIGLGLHYIIRIPRPATRTIAVGMICVVLLASAMGTVGGTVYWPNKHMTHAEYEGSEFVLSYEDPDVPIRAHSLKVKMEIYVTGNRSPEDRPPRFQTDDVTPGLGYPEHSSVGAAYGESYLVTQAYDVEFPRASYFLDKQREMLQVYDEGHLQRLARDPTAHKVYTNGEFTVWRVWDPGE